MKNFRTYDIAVQFYKLSTSQQLSRVLKEQLTRASSSIALNLAEGSGRHTRKDQKKFFNIALGSLRECQAILDLESIKETQIRECADKLGAHLFKLTQS